MQSNLPMYIIDYARVLCYYIISFLGGIIMKYILLLLSLFVLASCQVEEDPIELSSQTSIQSLDTDKIYIEGSTIYFVQGMVQSEFISLVEPIDTSRVTYRFLTNDNQIKTRSELFEYEKVEVTSEDGKYKKVYTLFYLYTE